MGRVKSVVTCRTSRGFQRAVRNQGGYIEVGGRHLKAYGADGNPGPVAIPRHTGDLPTGTAKSIMKGLLLIGFLIFLGACCIGAMLIGEADSVAFYSPVSPPTPVLRTFVSPFNSPVLPQRTIQRTFAGSFNNPVQQATPSPTVQQEQADEWLLQELWMGKCLMWTNGRRITRVSCP